MSDKKRKLFSFKRQTETPPPEPETARKLPKVNVSESAAAKPSDTDKIRAAKPKTEKIAKAQPAPEKASENVKGATTRISLPDDAKVRKARRAQTADDILPSHEIPSADQLREAAKNATTRIMIDTEDVVSTEASTRIPRPPRALNPDATLQIQTSELDAALKSGNTTKIETDQVISGAKKSTTRIDTGEVAPPTGERATRIPVANVGRLSKETTRIDTDEVKKAATTRIDTDEVRQVRKQDSAALSEIDKTLEIQAVGADSDKTLEVTAVSTQEIDRIQSPLAEDADKTLEIVKVGTQNLEDALRQMNREKPIQADQTIQIDTAALQTGPVDKVKTSDIAKALREASQPAKGASDQTIQIDTAALQTGPVDKVKTSDIAKALQAESKPASAPAADKTMHIDAASLQTGSIEPVHVNPPAVEKPAPIPAAPVVEAPGQRVRRVVAPAGMIPPIVPSLSKISVSKPSPPSREEANIPPAFKAETVPLDPPRIEEEFAKGPEPVAEIKAIAPSPEPMPEPVAEIPPPAPAPEPMPEPVAEIPAPEPVAVPKEENTFAPFPPESARSAFNAATVALDADAISREAAETPVEGLQQISLTRLNASASERTLIMEEDELKDALREQAAPTRGEKPVRKLAVKGPPTGSVPRPAPGAPKAPPPVVRQVADKPEAIDIRPDEKIFKEQTATIAQTLPIEAAEDVAPAAPAAEPEEAFNAKTMAMDPVKLDAELSKEDDRPRTVRIPAKPPVENLDKTMDMTEQRPKTIMIKRPGKDPSSPRTVKTVRPDAVTVRTARPLPTSGLTDAQKAGTSRVDVPEATAGEGKTVKLRRPGTGGFKSKAPVSRVMSNAGLSMNADGSVRQTQVAATVETGWTVVTILTTLIALGAVWVITSIIRPDLPMAGRVVDAQNQIVARTGG